MVCDTEYPSLRAASCCKVEVVKGGAGDFFTGFFVISSMLKEAALHDSKNSMTSFLSFRRLFSSAFRIVVPSGSVKLAMMRKAASDTNSLISRSRSTIRRTATDCTRPADKAGFTFRHRMGESSKPTIRSNTRRACCAFTKLILISRGVSIACKIAFLVISWKTIRFVFSGFNPKTSYRCQDIASPSRSSSDASHTCSAVLASDFNSDTSFFLSAGITYCGA